MIRKSRLILALSSYLNLGLVNQAIVRSPIQRRKRAIDLTSWASQKILNILNADLTWDGPRPQKNGRHGKPGRLIVANHLSYLDVLILSANWPSAFITSVEVENHPVTGTLSKLGGSLFVERRHRNRLAEDVSKLAHAINEGFDVVVFPEGTSHNGEELLPFKKGLLPAAVEARTEIVPICINYTHINGEPITKENRDIIYYYGGMSFGPHFGNALNNLKTFGAHIKVLEPIQTKPDSCRKELAEAARHAIEKHFKPIGEKQEDSN